VPPSRRHESPEPGYVRAVPLRSWLPDLRAVAVLFHVVAVVVLSIPVPPPTLRGEKEDARTKELLAPWGDAAEAVGIPRETLYAAIAGFTKVEAAALGAARTPLAPYARLVGAQQGWLMFGSVDTEAARIELHVRTGNAPWTPLFVPRSREAAWRRSFLEQERMRTLVYNFGAKRSRSKWEPFVTWLAREVREDRPDATALRVRMQRLRLPDPDQLRETGALELGDTYWVTEKRLAP
jgi:transposase